MKVVAAAALLVAVVAQAAAQKPPESVGEEVAVGASASGVPCRLRFQSSDAGNDAFRLVCEGWEQPVAFISREPQRRFTAATLIGDAPWIQRALDGTLNCAEPREYRLFGDVEAALRRCRMVDGGWPAVALAARDGGRIVYGWGPADALPAAEGAFALLLGRPVPAAGRDAQAIADYNIKLLEATLGAGAKVPGLDDVRSYRRLIDLSVTYNQARDYIGAENAARRAVDVIDRAWGPGSPNAFRALGELALNVGQQRRFADADAVYARAEAVRAPGLDPNDVRRYLAYRSFTESARGDMAAARRWAEESVKLASQEPRLRSGERFAHSSIALVAVAQREQRWAEVETLLTRALPQFEGSSGSVGFWPMRARLTLANALSEQGKHVAAEREARAGLAIAEQLYGDGTNTVQALLALGDALDSAGRRGDALAAYRGAAEFAARNRQARFQQRPETMRRYVAALLAEAAAKPAEAAALHDEVFRALQIPSDPVVARAVTLMAARLADSDPAVRDLTRRLQDGREQLDRQRQALATLAAQPADKRDAKREEAAQAAVRQTVERLDALERQLQGANPRYARLTAPPPLDAGSLGKLLRPGEALALLVPMESSAIGVVVRDGKAFAWPIAAAASALAARVDALRAGTDWARRGAVAFDLAEAHALYRDLLGPAEAALDGSRHLIVVAGGALASLPPALLVRRAGRSDDYAGAAWLARDVAISVVPSVAALAELRQTAQPSRATKPFLGFGAPAFAGADSPAAQRGLGAACREGGKLDPALVRALAPLPETADEIRGMARALKAAPDGIVLGAAATKDAVARRDLASYRVVAFATHGLLPGELACENEPALALTPPAGASGDDGLLNASDIARLRLDADWVVLSACNTAGADGARGGQALSGLVRAFLYAGSRAVLATHWAIASEPTVTLTTATFAAFAKPDTGRAEALRQAQLAMLKSPATAHPVFWGAFVVIGEGGR